MKNLFFQGANEIRGPIEIMVKLAHLQLNAVNNKYRPLVILHGLLGNCRNFYTLGKKSFALERDVWLLDLRNHGNSPHDDQMNYHVMANDVSYSDLVHLVNF